MKNWQDIYNRNADGFLYCSDFIQAHPSIPKEAKAVVLQAIADDLIKPSISSRIMAKRRAV